MSDNGDEHEALVPRRATMAASLDEASEGQLVSVDAAGNVRSLRRYRALVGVQAVATGVALALPVIYGLALGAAGAVVGGAVVGLIAVRLLPARRLRRGIELLQEDRLDEAEWTLRSVD